MKIIILHPHLAYPGGASKYMLEVAERMTRVGLDILVVTTVVNKEVVAFYPHLKFHTLEGPTTGSFKFWFFYPIFQYKLHQLLNQFPQKIIFPHILPSVWWAGVYKKFHHSASIIWMCQEPSAFVHSPLVIESLKQPMKTLVKLAGPLLRSFDLWLVKDIDYIIANSQYGATLIKKIYNRPADLIAYPSVNPQRFKPAKKKKNYFFTVSRLDKQKNVDIFLQAFKLLPRRLKDNYEIVIGGDGTERKNLEELAKELGIENKVKFLGWIKEENLPRWYGEAKLAVFCAKDEPFGIIPIEAMASGTVVIATSSGGIKESVREGKTGFLVEPQKPAVLARKIETVLKNEKKMVMVTKTAREHVEKKFSWDKTARQITKFFACLQSELENKI